MSGEGLTLVSNTVDRVTELCEAINSVLSSGTLKRSDGERLRGRLLFASGQLFGRKIRNLIRIVSKHIHSGRKIMGDEATDALKQIKSILVHNAPKKVLGPLSGHVHLYVDAPFEDGGYSGVGGVIYAESGEAFVFFSDEVTSDLVQMIEKDGQVTIIQELEMLALLIAFKLLVPQVFQS